MRLERILAMADSGVSFDSETDQIQPGLLAPPARCGSVAALDAEVLLAREEAGRLEAVGRLAEAQSLRALFADRELFDGALLTVDDAVEVFVQIIRDPTKIIVGANIAFDMLVMALECARRGIDIIGDIFRAYADERVFDLQIAEALDAIANGCLGNDPRTGKPLVNPDTGRRGMYSLAACVDLVLGRVNAKDNDDYRLRYYELRDTPIEQWPEPAKVYPVDDVRNTGETALAQCGHLPKTTPHHDWGPNGCRACGVNRFGEMCVVKKRHRNLHDHANQVWTAFAMHLGAAWGFSGDQSKVDVVEEYAIKKRAAGIQPFIDAGIIRPEGSVNEGVLKKLVVRAYNSEDPCPICDGTGKVLAPNPKMLQCPDCRGRSTNWKAGGKIKAPTVAQCDTCGNEGKVIDVRHRVTCRAPDGGVSCDGTGLELSYTVPRSDSGRVGKGMDVLHESGSEFVMSYGDFTEDAKWLKDYIPYLRKARREVSPGAGKYFPIPLTLSPNPILETGRVSYRGYIQLFPRWPGVKYEDPETQIEKYIPSFRECIVARPGYCFSSEDFRGGEIVTHAQSCKWLVGFSDLGDVLLSKDKNGAPMDPHSMLAATVLGVNYEEFIANKKIPRFAYARQSAKPFVFGKPGGMGDIKLVLQQRKQGPDTPHHTGPVWIEDENHNKVRGYKGLRFCILMGSDGPCGGPGNMIYEWKDKPIPPTCAACVDKAIWLGGIWKRQWRENEPYFKYVTECVNNGQVITWEMLQRWPHLQEWFSPNERLAPGEIMQHVSGRIRQCATPSTKSPFCAMSNGWFQGLLGDIAKAALRRVAWECYDRRLRVPDMLHANSIRSEFANCESPLFGSRPIVFQHDEIIAEHPLSIKGAAATRLSEIMRDEMRYYCPDYADAAEAEPTLMSAWSKSAAKVVHDDELQIWTPEHNPKTCSKCNKPKVTS